MVATFVVAAVIRTAKLYGIWANYKNFVFPINKQANLLLLNTTEEVFQPHFSFACQCKADDAGNEGEDEK